MASPCTMVLATTQWAASSRLEDQAACGVPIWGLSARGWCVSPGSELTHNPHPGTLAPCRARPAANLPPTSSPCIPREHSFPCNRTLRRASRRVRLEHMIPHAAWSRGRQQVPEQGPPKAGGVCELFGWLPSVLRCFSTVRSNYRHEQEQQVQCDASHLPARLARSKLRGWMRSPP